MSIFKPLSLQERLALHSPYSIAPKANIKVMRVKEMITN